MLEEKEVRFIIIKKAVTYSVENMYKK